MGSKTSENDDQHGYGDPTNSLKSTSTGGQPRGAQHSRDGDGSLGDGGDSDDEDADDNTASLPVALNEAATNADASKKKKRKRSKKKKKNGALKQSSPPRVALDQLFPDGQFPTGEFVEYNTARTTQAEMRFKARNLEDPDLLKDYRKAAETHRQVRHWVQEFARPGKTLTEITVGIDEGVRALLGNEGKETGSGLISGLGFPTGLSLNNIVAHFTPNPGQKDIVLQESDVMKVDFGVHVNGWIVDSAFTMSFDPVYDNLLHAVREATNAGIKAAGIDVRISDVSAAIQETMESHEVTINGKTYPVRPVRNICAHDIKQFRIHGSKQIPFIKNNDQTKMEEGEIFAIETFGTTGRGVLRDGDGVYGYGVNPSAPKQVNLPLASAGKLYKTIRENFGSIVFCRRYLEHIGQERYLAGLNCLVNNGVLDSYAPLVDIKGSYSAQFEHTILMRESSKEVISRGFDY